jgi:glyceraldehyde 3-phosphate dehydrogenase
LAVPRLAINGFGRIGRTITRIAKLRRHFDIVAINDVAPPDALLYAFQYDSIHGKYPGSASIHDDTMNIDGDPFLILSEEDPAQLPWKQLKVDYVVEATGKFKRLREIEGHLAAGARRVVLTVPCKDPLEATIVMGVNDHVVNGDSTIISSASCTTNCAAPVAKVLHDAIGIRRGLLSTVHAYTSDQRLIDAPHGKDMRRSRNAATNIVPTSTGAARAIGQVIPDLEGKLDGLAMRVPVADGSVVDMTLEVERNTTVEEVNALMRAAAEGPMRGILEYSTDPIVSSDIVGNAHSSIFDAPLTQVIPGGDDGGEKSGDNGTGSGALVKVIAWYDNEWGYSSRVHDLIVRLSKLDGMEPDLP